MTTSRTAPSPSSRCGTRATWATSPRTPPRRSSTATSPARRATPSPPATWATSRRRGRHRAARRPVPLQQGQHRRLQLLSRRPSRRGPSLTSGAAGAVSHPRPPAPPTSDHRTPSPAPKGCAMPRYCFQLQVKPDRIAEYRERHAAVWPDMLRALAETGWHNYSLFLRPDGLLIGYVESDDLAAAQAAHGRHRGQRPLAGRDGRVLRGPRRRRPTRGSLLLEEVFHLEDQLATDPTRPTTRTVTQMTTFAEITGRLEGLAIEVPSWAYGNSGTRFKVFGSPGTPRTVEEKIADAATGAPVHRARADGRAAHPVGPGRRLRRAARVRRGPRRRASAPSTPTRSRTTTTSSAASPTPTPRSAEGRSSTTSTASRSWTRPARAT